MTAETDLRGDKRKNQDKSLQVAAILCLPLTLLSKLYFILPVSVRIVAYFLCSKAIVAAIYRRAAIYNRHFKTTPLDTRESDMFKAF